MMPIRPMSSACFAIQSLLSRSRPYGGNRANSATSAAMNATITITRAVRTRPNDLGARRRMGFVAKAPEEIRMIFVIVMLLLGSGQKRGFVHQDAPHRM